MSVAIIAVEEEFAHFIMRVAIDGGVFITGL